MSAVTEEKRLRIDKLPDSNTLNEYESLYQKKPTRGQHVPAEDVSNSNAWSRWEGKWDVFDMFK